MNSLLKCAILLLLLVSGCSLYFSSTASNPINVGSLTQHWVHAWEEEAVNDSVMIYRPAGFREFPPSRFRMAYIFFDDGTCQWYYLAPNDGHHFRDGSWEFDPAEAYVIHVQQDDKTVSFRIIEVRDDILRMTPL